MQQEAIKTKRLTRNYAADKLLLFYRAAMAKACLLFNKFRDGLECFAVKVAAAWKIRESFFSNVFIFLMFKSGCKSFTSH